MRKFKSLLSIAVAACIAMPMNVIPAKASEDVVIGNSSFEEEINPEDIQLYKAKRTDEKAYDGKYSIKVGMEKPDFKEDVPMWQYNQGKGGMNVVVRDVEPNTQYTVKLRLWNETGVRLNVGLVDIEGSFDTPWNISTPIYENAKKSSVWEEVTNTITTGPRTDEFYVFAYCMNQKTGKDSGAFYIDDITIEKGETVTPAAESSIAYHAPEEDAFPVTIPAIQSFEKKEDVKFKLNTSYQIFCTDEFSKEKTEYLADRMVDKGIIDFYEIKMIEDVQDGEGIVVVKEPIQYELPESDVVYSEVDSYQVDISEGKVVIHSDYIEGIQNGTMTMLQAFAQRNELPTGTVKDYTDQRIRGFQIDTARTFVSVEWLEEQMEQMAYYKQNKLQLRLKDSEGIRWESEVVPELMDKDGYLYTKEDADELLAFASKFNIEIIPEVDYPGHSEMEVDMLENSGKTDWYVGKRYEANRISPILNIANEEVRQYITEVCKEAADFFHAKTIHIGGDEYFAIATGSAADPLVEWANETLGIKNADKFDAMKLYFNEVAGAMIDEGYNVLLWNDLVRKGGNVELDKRVTIDFWAGGWTSSYRGSQAAEDGYHTLSSSSTNYHNLWYQPRKESVRNPFPKEMYEKFTRYNYSVSSSTYADDEIITANKDKAMGQMFPIWSDILGGVSEPVLARTVFPRYGVFSYIIWGGQCEEKPLSYEEFERVMFALGSPREDIKTNVKINYNENDLNIVIDEIETKLAAIDVNEDNQSNIDKLNAKIADVKENTGDYAAGAFYTDIINELIHDVENLQYVKIVEEHIADKESLKEALETIKEIDLGLYTDDSVAILNEAVKIARRMIANPNSTQEEVQEAETLLLTASEQLVYRAADYRRVEEAIVKAEALNPENYIDFSGVEDAIEAVVYDLDITNQDRVDAMAETILSAIDSLVPAFELGDKTQLQMLVDEVDKLDMRYYTEASAEAFVIALEKAKEVLANLVPRVEEVEDALETLIDAKTDLVYKKADYSKVDAAVAEAEALNPDDYLNFEILESALDAIIYDLDITKQNEVDAMANAVLNAIGKLDSKYGYKGWLMETLEDAKSYDLNLYTEESAADLLAAIEAAEAILDNPKATQDELDDAEVALWDAMDYLKYKPADYSELNALVEKIELLNPEDFVYFEYVSDRILNIRYDYDLGKQNLVDKMVEDLLWEIENLEPLYEVGDIIVLQEKLDEISAMDMSLYTEESVAVLDEVIKSTQDVIDSILPKKEVVEARLDALNEAVSALEKKSESEETDKEDLAALIDYANKAKKDTSYKYVVAKVREMFEKALADAITVNDKAEATQAEVDAAYEALLKIVHLLEFKGNMERLESLVVTAREEKSEKYTPASWTVFAEALQEAEDILAGGNTLQEEVDAARTKLLNAIFGLREVPNKDKLDQLLEKVKAMDLSIYSAKTASAVKAAYAQAVAVFEDENADQKEVDAAVAALEKVIAGADGSEETDETSGSEDKVVSESTGNKTNTTGNATNKMAGNTAAKTGDAANTAIPAAAVLASVLAAIAAWRRKANHA